ncbi:MAG: hypothetical protein CME20_24515 [Gemmatimonadetes bacterium]|nr:hypothetical protein [Gemmatimonadota bacterium]
MRYCYMVIDFATIGDDLGANLDFIKSCGYDGVELNLTPELLARLDEVEPLCRERGLAVPSFLTGACYNEGLCLSVADRARREGAVERLKSYLPIAARFDAILVIGLLQGLTSDEPDAEAAHARIAAGLREVGLAALDAGVELVVEPINHLQVGFHHSVGEVRDLVAEVDVPAFKLMVDTIHMNIEETSLVDPIRACGAALKHVHLCESNGALLGSGHIDFSSVLAALDEIGYAGFGSVKVYRKAGFRAAAAASLDYLRSQGG